MKTIYTALVILITVFSVNGLNAQNIEDNKVNFQYIQLPTQKINPLFTNYEVRTVHTYKKANEDSLKVFEQQKELSAKNYQQQYDLWLTQKKTVDKQYLAQLAQYEKTINAGGTATAPTPPIYPASPLFVPVIAPRMHTDLIENEVTSTIDIKGYTKGLGGFIVTIDIHPIKNIRIVEKKTGTGTAIKYEYTCQYSLPVEVTLETPTEGVIYKKMMFDGLQSQNMKSYPSKYEFQSWWIDNEVQFYKDLERDARKRAFSDIAQTLNNEFGFMNSSRGAELYSVKKYRDYDYSDVTKAYTLTTQALNLVGKDRNRSGAYAKLDQAITAWKAILEESNMTDDKARINDKISGMIYCNLAELLVWRGDFDQAELYTNLALNSGVMKSRNHAERVVGFYADQKKRWQVHF
jgi:hypothetical protein